MQIVKRLGSLYGPVVRQTVGRLRMSRVREQYAYYSSDRSRMEIEAFQLRRFNQVWRRAQEQNPFYREWAERHELPASIEFLEDLKAFPPLTKGDLRGRQADIFVLSDGRVIDQAYSTGGSTGSPLRFPKASEEAKRGHAVAYAARHAWGILPFVRTVHVWGHAHLYQGGRLSGPIRKFKDVLVNTVRLNAYKTSVADLRAHLDATVRADPVFLIGYTSTIYKMAKLLRESGSRYGGRRLRAVMVTAETVSDKDISTIEAAFGVPVKIEYGAAETGCIAASGSEPLPLHVMWHSFIARVEPSGELLITTLDERAFPLINYAIGDIVEVSDRELSSVLVFDRVIGRTQEELSVKCADGREQPMSPILPVHILKSCEGILSVQYRRPVGDSATEVLITAQGPMDTQQLTRHLHEQLARDGVLLAQGEFLVRQIHSPALSLAGKQTLFV